MKSIELSITHHHQQSIRLGALYAIISAFSPVRYAMRILSALLALFLMFYALNFIPLVNALWVVPSSLFISGKKLLISC